MSDELLRTREAMRRRGPDGSGVWWSADRRLALGHRRLSILDLSSRAAQPMTSADGRLAITYNGEIYNFPELRAELERDGVRFRTSGDTELLLHLYARSGPSMVHRLRGMFAFAIWDDRSGELFLARDPYGIKPLYTANDGWTFRFASQVKALLAGGVVSRDPEPAGLAGFYLFGSVPEPFTLYREIRALPAGHTQIIDAGGPREPQPFANLAAMLAEGARDPGASRRTGGTGACRRRSTASVRTVSPMSRSACFSLPGSIPARCWGCCATPDNRKSRAITLQFDEFRGTAEDEAPLAAEIAARYGAEHIVRRVARGEFERDLPDILDAMDQPSIDGVNTWFVAKAANEAGLKVALSGIGGDEAAGRLSELSRSAPVASPPRTCCRHSGAGASLPETAARPGPRLLRYPSEGGRSAGVFARLGRRLSAAPRSVSSRRAGQTAGPADGARGLAPAAPCNGLSARR